MRMPDESEPAVVVEGDAEERLRELEAGSVNCVVTSPPYFGLRDYGHDGQIGLEATPAEYVARLVNVFREVRRVLADDGTMWLNLGDSYSGSGPSGASYQSATTRRRAEGNGVDGAFRVSKRLEPRGLTYSDKKPIPPPGFKHKDLLGIPWRVAFALQADGWYLRSDIIWSKPNPMPESVRDRPTKAHEYLFLLSKRERYWYDADAVAERAKQPAGEPRLTAQHKRAVLQSVATSRLGTNQGRPSRNRRSVWTVTPRPFKGAHFAVMPPELVRPCIRAGCRPGGVVLDPFGGSGTVGEVATEEGCRSILIELNPAYAAIARRRIAAARATEAPLFTGAAS